MAGIDQLLTQILNTKLGKDMRQAIHDSIAQCYDDVTSPELNVEAFEQAVQNKIDSGALATMTIPDGSITKEKLDPDLNDEINDIADLKFPQLDDVELSKETVNLDDTTYKVNNVLYSEDDVILGSYYDPETGELKTDEHSAMTPWIPSVPNGKISLPYKVDVIFFNKKQKYISGVKCNDTRQVINMPDDATWYALSTSTWGNTFKMGTHDYVVVYVSAYASEWHYALPDLGVQWEQVYGNQAVNQAVNDAAESKAYIAQYDAGIKTSEKLDQIYEFRKAVLLGVDPELFYDGFYPGYPYDPTSTMLCGITLYDESMDYVNILDDKNNPVNRTDIGTWAINIRDIIYFSGTNVIKETYTSWDEWNNKVPHVTEKYTLSKKPKYIKSKRSYNVVSTEEVTEDFLWVNVDEEKQTGFFEQINEYVQLKVEERINGDLGKRVKSASIKENNKTKDAVRIGTYNIYGAGHAQKNWQCVKEQLQDFGVDICAFQEVRSPNGNLDDTNTKKFSEEMIGWQFPYCSSNGDLYPTNERMLLSAWEIATSSEFEFDDWSSDKRCLAKYEVQLPLFKDRVGSDQIKMSVYNTQLEVSKNTSRVSEAQQILDEIAKDKNPFIVVCMDSNDFSSDKEIWKMFTDNGFSYAISVKSQTVRDQNNCIDQIFVNENMEVLHYDVINSNLYKFYKIGENMVAVSDHDLCFADVKLNYDNFYCVKQSLTNVSSDYSDVIISPEEPLTIRLSANNEYTLKTVSVRMGANDVTSDVYDSGVVTITEVTGDVHIIAIAN